MRKTIFAVSLILFAGLSCARMTKDNTIDTKQTRPVEKPAVSIVGTWHCTGTGCNRAGVCNSEEDFIMTITESTLSFNDRTYTYSQSGDTLYLNEDRDVTLTIVSLTEDTLLLGARKSYETEPDIAKFVRVQN